MEEVVSTPPPHNSTNDDIKITAKDSPAMAVFLERSYREGNHYIVLIIITFICTLITIAIAIVHMFYIAKYISLRRLRNNLYYIVALNPVCSLCCFFAMIMPRNLAFLHGVILTYQMIALRISIDVLFNISGGMRHLSNQLKACKENIKYKAIPFCCCSCLPELPPSVRNIRKLESTISQTCVLRIVLQVADICVMREIGHTQNWWFACSYFFSFITMIVALYVSCIINNLNRDTGNKYRYNYIFYMVNISHILYTSQRTLLCGVFYFKKADKSNFLLLMKSYDYFLETYYLMFAFSVELVIMSVIISVIMRPAVSHLFDSYSARANSPVYKMVAENSARPDMESKEPMGQSKEEVAPMEVTPMGPDTVMQAMDRDKPEPVKAKNPAAVEDDGNYENLHPQDEQDLKKVLKKMEKSGSFHPVSHAESRRRAEELVDKELEERRERQRKESR